MFVKKSIPLGVVLAMAAALAPALQAQQRLPWGALEAGNADGSIPAYAGGLPATLTPPGYKRDSGFWADPFADEKPLYVITGANMAPHADRLSASTQELLKRYPSFRVNVYPSRRTVSYPAWFVENTRRNAEGRCKTVDPTASLSGCFAGVPFPQPKTGYEAMWNMILAYKGNSAWTYSRGWYVDASGRPVMTYEINNRYNSDYYDVSLGAEDFYKRGAFFLAQSNIYTAPARNAGEGLMMLKSLTPATQPDRAWSYSPGQRRSRLAPDTAYDFPVANSGGAMLYDEIYAFSGRMDRFDFRIVGTQEMLVPYNAYRWYAATSKELIRPSHPNPDPMRWELHRMLVVEATLKPGQRHVVQKRRFYIDEDVHGCGMVDAWDASGRLSRGIWTPYALAYDKQIPITGMTWQYEFNTGVYFLSSVLADYKGLFLDIDRVDDTFYTPDGMARRTQR